MKFGCLLMIGKSNIIENKAIAHFLKHYVLFAIKLT